MVIQKDNSFGKKTYAKHFYMLTVILYNCYNCFNLFKPNKIDARLPNAVGKLLFSKPIEALVELEVENSDFIESQLDAHSPNVLNQKFRNLERLYLK